MTAHTKGKLTFRITAVLFVISAAFELFSWASWVPLFGSMRGGPAALIHHIFYAALYVALGAGLWRARHWGYTLVFIVTALYTFDKLQFVIYRKSILADLMAKPGVLQDVLLLVGSHLLLQVLTATAIIMVAGWWGFALYTYLRRDYFRMDGG